MGEVIHLAALDDLLYEPTLLHLRGQDIYTHERPLVTMRDMVYAHTERTTIIDTSFYNTPFSAWNYVERYDVNRIQSTQQGLLVNVGIGGLLDGSGIGCPGLVIVEPLLHTMLEHYGLDLDTSRGLVNKRVTAYMRRMNLIGIGI